MRMDAQAGLLPGVRRHPELEGSFLVDGGPGDAGGGGEGGSVGQGGAGGGGGAAGQGGAGATAG